MINKFDIIDIYILENAPNNCRLHIFFQVHIEHYKKFDHILGHQGSLNKHQKQIVQRMFSDHNVIKLLINIPI